MGLLLGRLALNTALVALIWNTLNLHGAFGLRTLSFVQCIGVGLGVMIFTGGA